FAYITYILYGMMYTAVNIPYGSLGSVVTDDEKERSSLSMWRSIGAGIGGLPSTILLPMLVYTTTISADGTKIQTLNGTKLTLGVLVLSVLSVAIFFGHYKLTKERLAPPEKQESNYNAFKTIKDLAKNRPFVMLCLISMLIIAFQFYYQSTYTYLFADYYHNAGLYSMVTICTYLPMAILIPIMNKLIDKFGKKELCAFGMAFAAIVSFVLFFIKTSNPYVFLGFTFLSGLGQTFLVLEIWALVMDVIDYHEIRTHRREEGTAYALVSFARKLGQTLAGAGLNALLALIHYSSDASANGQALPDDVLDKLYDISTLVPAIVLSLAAILLAFGYNITKKRLAVLHTELEEIRQNEE
ncbi:MAG: MFS transporter, partial [Eubacterium sp.]|nr:MFS transporter [Eubacterium sp.]